MAIRAARSLLLLVDWQTRLLDLLPAERRRQLLEVAGRLLDLADALTLPIVATAQYPQGLGPLDAAIGQRCPPALSKTQFSCLANPEIRSTLESHPDRRQIWLLGMETHICILQTALDLQRAGWEPVVIVDAVASRHPFQEPIALERMTHAGVTLSSAESLFYEVLADAAHPAFRALAPAWRRG